MLCLITLYLLPPTVDRITYNTRADKCDRHDDITYQSIAKAFGLDLKLHNDAHERMKKLSRPHPSQPKFNWDEDSPAKRAKLRMVELPTDESRDMDKQFLFPREELWVPVCVVNGNVHILPGVPKLCKSRPWQARTDESPQKPFSLSLCVVCVSARDTNY